MSLSFKHSGSSGDIIYSLPSILAMIDKHGGPANIYLQPGVLAHYYMGCEHPAGNFRMNKEIAEALMPLLSAQPGIATVKIWENEKIDIDLDMFRKVGDLRVGHLPRHYAYAFDCYYDLSSPWLDVVPKKSNRIVVSRTSRYRNSLIKYNALTPLNPLFVGLKDEWRDALEEVPSLEYAPTKDFYEVAALIAGADAFVGNQSVAFAIAEGLKVPRLLETCPFARNVQPMGGLALDAINGAGWEAELKKLING